jgi:hypothetical protein
MQKNIRKKIKKNLNGNGIKNKAAPIITPVNMAFKTCIVFITLILNDVFINEDEQVAELL